MTVKETNVRLTAKSRRSWCTFNAFLKLLLNPQTVREAQRPRVCHQSENHSRERERCLGTTLYLGYLRGAERLLT
jgi:hypothetical protein